MYQHALFIKPVPGAIDLHYAAEGISLSVIIIHSAANHMPAPAGIAAALRNHAFREEVFLILIKPECLYPFFPMGIPI